MGIYLNPGKASFEEAVNSQIFVDKTEMICFLNTLVKTKQKYVSVSRPRRFGKTMAADMICAYFDREADSRELFEKCNIRNVDSDEKWDKYLGHFDVIRISMTDFFNKGTTIDAALDKLQKLIIRDLVRANPEVDFYDKSDLLQSFQDIYAEKKTQFVIVIDEWDAVFREYKENKEGQDKYLDFLRDWMKDKPYIALAYMTGILPIKKYGKHSALNMFREYSMMYPRQLAQYTGFTESEVQTLCGTYGRNYEAVKDWYDGYDVSDIIPPDPGYKELIETGQSSKAVRYSLYSPLSVVEAMTTGVIRDYWNQTETYEALAEYIRRDYDGLKDAVALLMDGGRVKIDTSTYQNDMTTFYGRDDVLSLLIHLGYLGYDDEKNEVFIPNREILDEFKTSTKGTEWVDTFEQFRTSQELLKATWSMNAEKVAELVEKAHNKAGNMTYHDEAGLSYGIRLAYYAAEKYYTLVPEFDSGKGYADLVCLPSPDYADKPVLLIELKYEKTVESALAQIKRQEYPDRLVHYKGNILLVSISYHKDVPNDSPEFKHHSCVIEKA